MTLDASNLYKETDEREETEGGGYATGKGADTVLHYPKDKFTKKDVLKDKSELTKGWWVVKTTKDEYQLVMNPRLKEGSKLTSKKPLTYAEQKKFGVYETEQSADNRRVALSMESMFEQAPNPAFSTAVPNAGFAGNNVRDHNKDMEEVRTFYGF